MDFLLTLLSKQIAITPGNPGLPRVFFHVESTIDYFAGFSLIVQGFKTQGTVYPGQSWALALFSRFALCSPLNFYPWIAIAHFADFQVRSSLNRSHKDQWFALGKER